MNEKQAKADAWRRANPGVPFHQYYTDHHLVRARAGGKQVFLAEALSPEQAAHVDRVTRRIVAFGLQPHHRCVDYGCGGLAIGRWLIDYLDAGCYHGLDVSAGFLELGRNSLADQLVAEKEPRLSLIEEGVLREMAPPDYLLVLGVLQHIPPEELHGFMETLFRMVGPETTMLLSAKIRGEGFRVSWQTWAYPMECLANECQLGATTIVEAVEVETPDRHRQHDIHNTWLRIQRP